MDPLKPEGRRDVKEAPNADVDWSQIPPTDNDKANWNVETEARNHGIDPDGWIGKPGAE